MKIVNILFIIVGVAGLIGVRKFEGQLFYDPFLKYFQEANVHTEIPSFVWGKLIVSHLFRFALNLAFSALIVHFIFKNMLWTKQAVFLMTLVFLITFSIYLYCISTDFSLGYLFSFYMRRFVIQPLILLLIVPLFYYRKHLNASPV